MLNKTEDISIHTALRTLESLGPLSDDDRDLVRAALQENSKSHRLGATLGDSGDGRCWFLVEGWACRARILADGRRQIFDFILPGEVVGLRTLDLPAGLYRIVALTQGSTLDADNLKDHVKSGAAPGMIHICHQNEHRDTARLFDQISRLSARTAFEATANLFVDLHRRAEALGLCIEGRFPMPLSQAVLSEALGITPMQINRILTRLRRDGLMMVDGGWVRLIGVADVAALAGSSRK